MKSRRTFLKSLFAAPAALAAVPTVAAPAVKGLLSAEELAKAEAGMKLAALDPDAVRKLWVQGVTLWENQEDFFKAFETKAESGGPITLHFGNHERTDPRA